MPPRPRHRLARPPAPPHWTSARVLGRQRCGAADGYRPYPSCQHAPACDTIVCSQPPTAAPPCRLPAASRAAAPQAAISNAITTLAFPPVKHTTCTGRQGMMQLLGPRWAAQDEHRCRHRRRLHLADVVGRRGRLLHRVCWHCYRSTTVSPGNQDACDAASLHLSGTSAVQEIEMWAVLPAPPYAQDAIRQRCSG